MDSEQLKRVIGPRLLSYMLGIPPSALDGVLARPGVRQGALVELRRLAVVLVQKDAALPPEMPKGHALTDVVRAFDQRHLALATQAHLDFGSLPAIDVQDRQVALAQSYAIEVLPALIADGDAADALTPFDDRWRRAEFRHGVRYSSEVAGLATEALAEDPLLASLFPGGADDQFRSAFILYGNGSGNSVQLPLMLDALIDAAWSRTASDSVERFLKEVRRSVVDARQVAQGIAVKAPTFLGLVGILVDAPISLPWGILRPANASDFDLGGGVMELPRITAVLELERLLDCTVGVAPESDEFGFASVREWRAQEEVAITKTALTLMLALGDLDSPPIIREIANRTKVPVSSGGSIGHSGNSPFVRQTEVDVSRHGEAIRMWADLVERGYADPVAIAVRRAVRAVGERADVEDALIDAVISLESLFSGRSSGDLSFRIGGSVAWLLEPDDSSEREAVFGRVKDIYSRRSEVVHGRKTKPERTLQARDDAIKLLVRVLQRLFRDRPDLLDVEDRSKEILVRARPTTPRSRPEPSPRNPAGC